MIKPPPHIGKLTCRVLFPLREVSVDQLHTADSADIVEYPCGKE